MPIIRPKEPPLPMDTPTPPGEPPQPPPDDPENRNKDGVTTLSQADYANAVEIVNSSSEPPKVDKRRSRIAMLVALVLLVGSAVVQELRVRNLQGQFDDAVELNDATLRKLAERTIELQELKVNPSSQVINTQVPDILGVLYAETAKYGVAASLLITIDEEGNIYQGDVHQTGVGWGIGPNERAAFIECADTCYTDAVGDNQ